TWSSCIDSIFRVCAFFFSSRRRHTICYRDWSSDVCSSDLDGGHLARFIRDVHFAEAHAFSKRSMDLRAAVSCSEALGASGPVFRSEERRVGKRGDLWGRSAMRGEKRGLVAVDGRGATESKW